MRSMNIVHRERDKIESVVFQAPPLTSGNVLQSHVASVTLFLYYIKNIGKVYLPLAIRFSTIRDLSELHVTWVEEMIPGWITGPTDWKT